MNKTYPPHLFGLLTEAEQFTLDPDGEMVGNEVVIDIQDGYVTARIPRDMEEFDIDWVDLNEEETAEVERILEARLLESEKAWDRSQD